MKYLPGEGPLNKRLLGRLGVVKKSRNTLLNLFESFGDAGEELGMHTHDIEKGGSAGKSKLRSKWTHQKLLAVSSGSYKIKYAFEV